MTYDPRAVLHDDHGPCAPLGPLSAEDVGYLRKLQEQGYGLPVTADLRDEKIEALTTLVTEMGAIIAEQRAQLDELGCRIGVLGNRLNALHQIVSDGEVNEAVENFQLVNSQLSRLRVRVDALESRPGSRSSSVVGGKLAADDDPTMRAMSSLRAKGLA